MLEDELNTLSKISGLKKINDLKLNVLPFSNRNYRSRLRLELYRRLMSVDKFRVYESN